MYKNKLVKMIYTVKEQSLVNKKSLTFDLKKLLKMIWKLGMVWEKEPILMEIDI